MKAVNAHKAINPGKTGSVERKLSVMVITDRNHKHVKSEINILTRILETLVEDKVPYDNLFDGSMDKKATTSKTTPTQRPTVLRGKTCSWLRKSDAGDRRPQKCREYYCKEIMGH